ncbi:proline racemase family protein [Pararobbsia silviterrae]|uniref:Proline racemase n=1 Tax=Pararobbsia silviterrae TaxID=1792498 RepID=A0A494YBQ9_9BURK|nr:proline racemase family protein [Pararobbsia silviterrae]RKP57720.1 proline racemase [Pararobbsia silviterrae]
MRSRFHYSVVDVHSAGAQARVVIGGIPQAPGASINEKRLYLREHFDHVRKVLMYEPRGGAQMSGSLIVEPCDPRADVGIIFIESGGWLTMCGAGTIGAATALVETGMFAATEPQTTIVFDTPAGLVTALVEVRDGSVKGVSLENVPSYLAVRDHRIEMADHGAVNVDIAYGGNFYVIVPAARFGLEIKPQQADRLVKVGREVRALTNASITVKHPLAETSVPIPNVIFTGPGERAGAHRNLVLFGEAGVDRSPGGTGTSARMAQLYGRGELGLDETFIHESIIGSVFEGRLTQRVVVGDTSMVVPRVKGRAFIIGLRNFYVDPADPFQEGFGVGYAADAIRPSPSLIKALA